MGALEIILIVIASIAGLIALTSANLARFLVFPLRLRHSWVIGMEERKGLISIDAYENLNKEKLWIASKYGYKLYAELVLNPQPSDKTVILMHGYRFNLVGSIKYGMMFLDMGYNVLWFDNCKSGNSGGRTVTMGHREKDDLGAVVNVLRERFGGQHKIGIHGESMGASASLLYASGDPKISFVVADCGYSDLNEEICHHLKKKLHLPKIPFLPLASFFVKLFARFNIKDISPLTKLKEDNALAQIPVLFIHGEKDDFTPTKMACEMYEAKKGVKEIYLCEGAKHAQSFINNKEHYKNVVKDFLEKISF